MTTVVDENDAFATVLRGPGVGIDLAGDPLEFGMRRVPDRLELFRAGHAVARAGLVGDDGGAHLVWGLPIRQVAKAMEPAFAAPDSDREEYAGHIAGLELRHAEHAGAHEERRQQIEHEVVF